MPEIQMTDIAPAVSLPETKSQSKSGNFKMISRTEKESITHTRRQTYADTETDESSGRGVSKVVTFSTVRDNILSAHEKIMNGHYEEILNEPQAEHTHHLSETLDVETNEKINDLEETSQNYEVESDTLQDRTTAEDLNSSKRLKDLISKEALENLSQEQCQKIANDLIHCYDARVYHPIRPGQQEDELNVPIMSPPPVEKEPKYELGEFRSNFCRSLAAEFIKPNDLKACKFAAVKTENLLKTLSLPYNSSGKPNCICASQNIYDDSLSGWETPPKFSRSKHSKKRKSSRLSSEVAFSRLTGQLILDKDPFSFQHFKDPRKFIEHYRFLHTVGGVCSERPMTTKSNLSRHTEEEAYYNKLRSAFCAMASSFDLRTLLQDRDNTSSSSSERNEKMKSDDESVDDSNVDAKILSMKDRGKTLNLAPVRECTVPDLIKADNFDQLQQNYATINQYLNLMTPPLPADCLRLAYEAAKARRHGGRLPNGGDSHLFPNPKRKATPLRLGSAEFVKPGTPEQFAPPEVRWNSERRASMQRSSTFHSGTVPGNLYVGSTVTSSPAHQGRSRSSGKPKSYIPSHHTQQQPKDAPHKIYGKKFKPCERMNELAKDRMRGREEKVVPLYQTTGVEQNNYARKQDRLISVNVNHLGIRGRTFKPEELSVYYKFDKDKNRRVATLASNAFT